MKEGSSGKLRTRSYFCGLLKHLTLALIAICYAASVQAALFEYATNEQSLVITRYLGPGGPVVVPSVVWGMPVVAIGDQAFANNSTVTTVEVQPGVTSIGPSAFELCWNLKSVVIGRGLTNLGYAAFSNCQNLTNIGLPDGLLEIGESCFEMALSLSHIDFPDSVRRIGLLAFYSNESIQHVRLPGSLKTIAPGAFMFCQSLSVVEFPAGLTNIGNQAFMYCRSLREPGLPLGLNTIEGYAFANCTSFTNVVIPESVRQLGEFAFLDCTNLVSIVFHGDAPSTGTRPLLNTRAVAYYMPGKSGWGPVFDDHQARLLCPGVISTAVLSATKELELTMQWREGSRVVLEFATNLPSVIWTPLSTNQTSSGRATVRVPHLQSSSEGFYRVLGL